MAQNGRNELTRKTKNIFLTVLAEQFKDYMVLVLVAAVVISMFLKEFTEAISILVIIFANALLGIVQSYRTEHALESLTAMSAPHTRVLRDGVERVIPSAELVVGDVMVLRTGDRVGADGVLIERNAIACDESMLTGESVPVRKTGADKACRHETSETASQLSGRAWRPRWAKLPACSAMSEMSRRPCKNGLKASGRQYSAAV